LVSRAGVLHSPAAGSAVATRDSWPPELILIVGDDPAVQVAARAALERKGYCAVAARANEARLILRIVSPALILIDVDLTGNEALALIRSLKRMPHTRRIPIVAMAGPTLDSEAAAAYAGCEGFVIKPIDGRRLGTKVAGFIDRGHR
jgi:CheY-like chemotaxis protein